MVNPHALSWISVGSSVVPGTGEDERSGNDRDGWTLRFGWANILPAFGSVLQNERGEPVVYETPMAIIPDYLHPRMQVQRSRFTAHSIRRTSLHEMFRDEKGADLFLRGFLRRIDVAKNAAPRVHAELHRLGISRSVLFPDIEGLSKDMGARYFQASGQP